MNWDEFTFDNDPYCKVNAYYYYCKDPDGKEFKMVDGPTRNVLINQSSTCVHKFYFYPFAYRRLSVYQTFLNADEGEY